MADDLVGKEFGFEYTSETYVIQVMDGETLNWTQSKGPNQGNGDTERYNLSNASDTLMMISWVEVDGLGLTNLLDMGNMTLTTHASMGRDVFVNRGKLAIR